MKIHSFFRKLGEPKASDGAGSNKENDVQRVPEECQVCLALAGFEQIVAVDSRNTRLSYLPSLLLAAEAIPSYSYFETEAEQQWRGR
jgi:hypothetical protein